MSSNNSRKMILSPLAISAVDWGGDPWKWPGAQYQHLLKNGLHVAMYYSRSELHWAVPEEYRASLEKDLATAVIDKNSGLIFMTSALYRKMFSYIFGDPSGKTNTETEE